MKTLIHYTWTILLELFLSVTLIYKLTLKNYHRLFFNNQNILFEKISYLKTLII